MATRSDVYNYSGYSFEQMVDTVMQLELDNKNLQDAYDELEEEKNSLVEEFDELKEEHIKLLEIE